MAEGWRVLTQDVKPTIDGSGRFVDEVVIRYVVTEGPAKGHEDQISVSREQYTDVDNVRTLIDNQVAVNNAVAGL